MKQAEKNRINRTAVTSEDHLFRVGNVELCIKAGTDVNDCLEDVDLFTKEARQTLVELVRDRSGDTVEIDSMVIWGMSHMLDLAHAMNQAALKGLLAGESTRGAA